MQSFKEFLAEATTAPIELKELIENYPNNYMKMIHKLWGGKRLVYKGQRFFDDTGFGPVYEGATKAVEELDKKMELDFHLEDHNGDIHETTASVEVKDMQEVYLGYNKTNDKLYIGYDAWVYDAENVFNELADEANLDPESLEHDAAWKKFLASNQEMMGILFALTTTDGVHFEAEPELEMQGGFYGKGGLFRTQMFKQLHLIDLRLD